MNRFILQLILVALITPRCLIAQNEIGDDQVDNDLDMLTDCADPDINCETAFPCQEASQLYQYIDGKLFEYIDEEWEEITGWTNDFQGTEINLNAMGYNIDDGFIYGIDRATSNLVRISTVGIESSVDVGLDPQQDYTVGDMDLEGNLYVTNASGSAGMAIIDVSAQTSTVVNFNGLVGQLRVWDWAYLPATGKLYGIVSNQQILRSVNLDGTVETDISITGIATSGYGAMFADNSGNLYAAANDQGQFYILRPNGGDFTNFNVEQLASTGSAVRNDGAACALSGPPPPPPDDCCERVLEILRDMKDPAKNERNFDPIIDNNSSLNNYAETASNNAVLFQNAPNPFNNNTIIRYEIYKASTSSALIHVFDLSGKLVSSFDISNDTKGQVIIEGYTLEPGMYLYSLVVDNTIVDTKRMILTN